MKARSYPLCVSLSAHRATRENVSVVITSMRACTPGISALPCRGRAAVQWVVEVKPTRYGDVSRQVGTALHGRRTGVVVVREAGSPSSQTGTPSLATAAFWEGLAVR
jgi:hypothetical protein